MESYVKNQKFHLIIHHKVKRVLFAIFLFLLTFLGRPKARPPFLRFSRRNQRVMQILLLYVENYI